MISTLPTNKTVLFIPYVPNLLEVGNMLTKLKLTWYINNSEIDSEIRYCHNCGLKVEFKDSMKRRQNANGKNIFYFSIYKCPKGHTWNKAIDTFKTLSGLENTYEEAPYIESKYEELNILLLKEAGIKEINILLKGLSQKIRLDKFLSEKIMDISRTELVKLIDKGLIRINGKIIKAKIPLKEEDIISLML